MGVHARRHGESRLPLVLALVASVMAVGCDVIPPQLRGGTAIVMEVANKSARPAALIVAAHGNIGQVVGSAEPAVVPAAQTVMVRFLVPPSGWAIWANGGELMGDSDVRGKRGNIPMGIEIGPDGVSWWCRDDCP